MSLELRLALVFAGVLLAIAGVAFILHEVDVTPLGLEFTGTVFDERDGQPIEGAFVIATYLGPNPRAPNARPKCAKSRGMYTGKDGKFRFPVEKLTGVSPIGAAAMKPGYFRGRMRQYGGEGTLRFLRNGNANQDLYLVAQNPEKPTFLYGGGDEICTNATSHEDVAAAVTYFRIVLGEYIRLGVKQDSVEAVRDIIRTIEEAPGMNEVYR
jgi:hypothetical protein